MALVNCPDCSCPISELAITCPRCGGRKVPSPTPVPPAPCNPQAVPVLESVPPWLLTALVVCLLLLNGGVLAYFATYNARRFASAAQADLTQVIQSGDGRLQVTLPAGWSEAPPPAEFGDGAVFYAVNEVDDLVLIILSEDKVALQGLDQQYQQIGPYSGLLRKMLTDDLKAGTQEEPSSTTISGLPAIQSVIRGSNLGVDLTMLHTIVETPTTFYQIRVFTTADRFPAFQEELASIAASVTIDSTAAP